MKIDHQILENHHIQPPLPPVWMNVDILPTPLKSHVDFHVDPPPFISKRFSISNWNFWFKTLHKFDSTIKKIFWIYWFQIAFIYIYLHWFRSVIIHVDSTSDPPSPLVDLCGYLENPPSPLDHPHGLWMFPYSDSVTRTSYHYSMNIEWSCNQYVIHW